MFDCPLHLPVESQYSQLHLRPDSIAEEIREAKTEAVAEVKAERSKVIERVRLIEDSIPGFAAARMALQHGEKEGHEQARRTLVEFERLARQREPGYDELKKKAEELARRETEINGITLETPDDRAKHDSQHPPFGLLKIEDATSDGFVEIRNALGLVRREVSEFLETAGEPVFHPSDIYRRDFSADHTPNSILDA